MATRQPAGMPGLPEAVPALVVPPDPGPGSVRIRNGRQGSVRLEWRPGGTKDWQGVLLAPAEEVCVTLSPA